LGEITALEWTDINFNQNTIKIDKSAGYIPGIGSYEKDPKTKKGHREIELPPLAMEKIRKHQLEQKETRLKMGDLWEDHNKVFTQENGRPMFHGTLSKWFSKWLEASGLPKLKFHGLRHSNISWLIAEGVDIATVSRRAGHANIATTMSIYTHALQKKDSEAASKLEKLFTIEEKAASNHS